MFLKGEQRPGTILQEVGGDIDVIDIVDPLVSDGERGTKQDFFLHRVNRPVDVLLSGDIHRDAFRSNREKITEGQGSDETNHDEGNDSQVRELLPIHLLLCPSNDFTVNIRKFCEDQCSCYRIKAIYKPLFPSPLQEKKIKQCLDAYTKEVTPVRMMGKNSTRVCHLGNQETPTSLLLLYKTLCHSLD